nr:orcokinin peptides-like isoform X2 [Maniola hyperantus]
MMRAGGAVAMAVATLLVCCSADPHQEQDVRVGGQNTGDHDDVNDFKQREELEDFLRFLIQYVNKMDRDRNLDGIGGTTFLGRNFDTYENRPLRGPRGGLLDGKNIYGIGGSPLLERNMENKMQYTRYLDSLGGGNFVRTLDTIGGGNFVRNLDSIGGANFVKKNLDQIGGPNLVKRHLDSLGGGHNQRNLDSLGGGNLVRQVRELRHFPYFMGRRFEYSSPYGGKRDTWPLVMPIEYGYYGDGLPKRNFDEIDRSNLDNFVKKRNFDEIDQTSMPFPFKRFYHFVGPNYLDSVSSFDKKRYRPDFPMDEIDLSQFPIGSKRSEMSPHNLR